VKEMRNSEELMEIIQKHLEEAVEDLWIALTPEERRVVFNALINEWLGANY